MRHSCGHNHSNQCKISNGECVIENSVATLPHVLHPGYTTVCHRNILVRILVPKGFIISDPECT